jgi:anti-sigma regulatory factor (Ser/Thr protein kinase)
VSAITARLPRSPDAVRIARRLVQAHATGLAARRREDAGLLVSELVANALVHGRGAIALRIDRGFAHLRIEVADEGEGTIALNPAPGVSGGWGLHVVDRFAASWGIQQGSHRVWFRLDLDERPTAGLHPPRY